MYPKQIRLYPLGFLGALLLLLIPSSVPAQQLEAAVTFVYGVNTTLPGEVFASLSPPQIDEIYILANSVTVLSPKQTELLFWPLTQRYRANWTELNEPLDGVLEILADERGG